MIKQLKRPRAMLFDWDNTLVDSWPVIHHSLNLTLRAFGRKDWSMEETQSRVRKSMRDSFPEMFGNQWNEAAKHYQTTYRAHHLTMLQPLPGAQELLEMLVEMQLLNAVVSNKRGPTLRTEVEHLGWGKYFSVLIGSEDTPQDKPSAVPAQFALEKIDCDASQCWFIGDSEVDLECAAKLPCISVLYGPVVAQHAEFDAAGVYRDCAFDAYVPDHAALQALILASV